VNAHIEVHVVSSVGTCLFEYRRYPVVQVPFGNFPILSEVFNSFPLVSQARAEIVP